MATQRPSTVINRFVTNVAIVTTETPDSGFQESPYREQLEQEWEGGIEGMFFVEMVDIVRHAPTFGATETILRGTVVVRVAYIRWGGDMDEGDRKSVNRNAADDMHRLSDVCENPDNYSGTTTGIRLITFLGASRVYQAKGRDIWEARFLAEWRSDLITT